MRHVFKAGVLAALSPVVFVFILDISSLVKILQVIQSAGRVKVADPCAIGELDGMNVLWSSITQWESFEWVSKSPLMDQSTILPIWSIHPSIDNGTDHIGIMPIRERQSLRAWISIFAPSTLWAVSFGTKFGSSLTYSRWGNIAACCELGDNGSSSPISVLLLR